MIEVLVWMLISVSYSSGGGMTVVGTFKTELQCAHVMESIPRKSSFAAKCIQANIYIPKAGQ